MSTLLILGASVSQIPAIRKARSLGLRVIVVDGDPQAVGFVEADVAEVVDFSDVPAVVDVARRHHALGVVAVSTDRGVAIAAAVSDELGLPGIGTTVATAMTHKGVMRERLGVAGLPQPPFAVVGPGDDLTAVLGHVGTPAVIKPVDSGGQRGVFIVETADELRQRLGISLAFSRCGRAIVERFIPGSELNVIAVVAGGTPHILTLSDRLRPPGQGFGVGWAHVFPSRLPEEVTRAAASVAAEAVIALGLMDSVAFPQLLACDGEVLVVEVAARVAAGQMADVVRHGIGVDVIEIAIRQALGHAVDADALRPRFVRPVAVRFFTASPGPLPTGRLRAVRGLERVRAAPGVLDAGLYLQPGEVIKPVQVDADRRGYVIATAEDPARALALADEAATLLELDVEQDLGNAHGREPFRATRGW
jgi:biotin carboxylase